MPQDMEERSKEGQGAGWGHLGVGKSFEPCSGLNSDPKHTQVLICGKLDVTLQETRSLEMGQSWGSGLWRSL